MIQRALMDEVKRVLVEEAQTDTVGLWAVLWDVELEIPSLTVDEARQATLTVIREALMEDHIVVGGFVDQDEEISVFVPWGLSVDDAVTRIEREWVNLGRKPDLGEIAWFVDPHLLPVAVQKYPMGRDWKPMDSKPS